MSASASPAIPSTEGRPHCAPCNPRLPHAATRRSWRGSSGHLAVWGAIGIAALFLVPVTISLSGAHPSLAPRSSSLHHADAPAAELAAARQAAMRGQGPGQAGAVPALPRGASSPPVIDYSFSMVYDAADGYVVAVDPNTTGELHNTTYGAADLTWIYAGGNWTLANTTGAPPTLIDPGLVYDAADEYVLLFGGLIIAGTQGQVTEMVYSNQTWSYSNGVWTNRTVSTAVLPPTDEPVLMAYDAADGYVVLLDGAVVAPDTMVPTTWSYRADVWTNISGPSTAPRVPYFGAMSYDAADGCIVAFGELVAGPGVENWVTLNITWTFAAGAWKNVTTNITGAPPGRIAEGMTYDTALGEVVLFGGEEWHGFGNYSIANDTWAYSAGNWTNLNLTAPGPAWFTAAFTYDPATGQLLLAVEGNNSTSALAASEIWALSNRTWTPLAPLLIFGAIGADVGVPFGIQVRTPPHEGLLTYRYTNLPPGCTSVNAPSLTCVTQASGSYRIGVAVNDTIGDSTLLATTVVVNPRPVLESFGASSALVEVGVPFSLTAVAGGGTGTLSYGYAGLPSGCVSPNAPTVVCTPSSAGSPVVTAQVTDSLGVVSAASINLVVADRPSVTTFVAVPSSLDVGQTTVFAALTSGGVGPDSYAYGGLPTACPTVDQLSFGCRPQVAGPYQVSFMATDSFGVIASGAVALTVNPPPAIAAFTVSSAQVAVGTPLAFALAIAGGTAPYSYVYAGLPAGCTSNDAAALQCAATVPGNYTVSVTATDATGASVTGTTRVEVAAVPVVSHPTTPGGGLSAVSGLNASMFEGGLLLGSLALVAVAWSARRQSRARAEGEAIVAQLQGSVHASDGSRLAPPAEGRSIRADRER